MEKYNNSTKSDKDIYQGNIVAEERASYNFKRRECLTPYTDRNVLIPAEKPASAITKTIILGTNRDWIGHLKYPMLGKRSLGAMP
jgi:hypothetical protein